jgi:hypothetical protein
VWVLFPIVMVVDEGILDVVKEEVVVVLLFDYF